MQLFDTLTLADANVRFTDDGYMVANPRVARTGIQRYLGSELGKPEMQFIDVYRPPEAVFDAAAMHSYAYRPVTNDHQGTITAENWKQHATGQTGGEVIRDGDFVRVPLVLMDSSTITAYKNGKKELSMGYDADVIFEDGVTPGGESYNAVIKSMRMNHLALVDAARGGDQLRIGDGVNSNQPTGGPQMAELKKVLIDGLTVETTEQGAQAVTKLQAQLADAQAAIASGKAAHAADVARLEAERDDLKGKVLTDAQIEARATARAALLDTARRITAQDGAAFAGKSDAEVRRAVVLAKIGDASILDGKSDDYVAARFDLLAADAQAAAQADPIRAHMLAQDGKTAPAADNGQSAYEKRLADAWKTPARSA